MFAVWSQSGLTGHGLDSSIRSRITRPAPRPQCKGSAVGVLCRARLLRGGHDETSGTSAVLSVWHFGNSSVCGACRRSQRRDRSMVSRVQCKRPRRARRSIRPGRDPARNNKPGNFRRHRGDTEIFSGTAGEWSQKHDCRDTNYRSQRDFRRGDRILQFRSGDRKRYFPPITFYHGRRQTRRSMDDRAPPFVTALGLTPVTIGRSGDPPATIG